MFKVKGAFYFSIFGLFILASIGCASCVSRSFSHSPKRAASVSADFINYAFIRRDFERAAAFVHGNELYDAIAQVQKIANEIHPDGRFPTKTDVESFEPALGNQTIRIFVDGFDHAGERNFQYCVVLKLEGDDYRVVSVYGSRDGTPFPASGFRKSF